MNGRPLKFSNNPQELETKINEYFSQCIAEKRPLTISGLAFALDTNRQTLLNYAERSEFFDTIKRAKARIEAWVEEQLFRNGQVAGVIFNLKNNYRWKDTLEVSKGIDFEPLTEAQEMKILSMVREAPDEKPVVSVVSPVVSPVILPSQKSFYEKA